MKCRGLFLSKVIRGVFYSFPSAPRCFLPAANFLGEKRERDGLDVYLRHENIREMRYHGGTLWGVVISAILNTIYGVRDYVTPQTMSFFSLCNARGNTLLLNWNPRPNRRIIHPILDQNDKIYTLFQTRNAWKWYPSGRHIPIWLTYGSTRPSPPPKPRVHNIVRVTHKQTSKSFFRQATRILGRTSSDKEWIILSNKGMMQWNGRGYIWLLWWNISISMSFAKHFILHEQSADELQQHIFVTSFPFQPLSSQSPSTRIRRNLKT